MTVWGQGTVNVNTANPLTLYALICSGAPQAELCTDPTADADVRHGRDDGPGHHHGRAALRIAGGLHRDDERARDARADAYGAGDEAGEVPVGERLRQEHLHGEQGLLHLRGGRREGVQARDAREDPRRGRLPGGAAPRRPGGSARRRARRPRRPRRAKPPATSSGTTRARITGGAAAERRRTDSLLRRSSKRKETGEHADVAGHRHRKREREGGGGALDLPQARARAPRVGRRRRERRSLVDAIRDGRRPRRCRGESTGRRRDRGRASRARAPRSTGCYCRPLRRSSSSDVLAYELEAQVPFDLERRRVRLAAARAAAATTGSCRIVAAVARVDDVRARIDLVKEATGYEPERVGVGAFTLGALVPTSPRSTRGGTVAVVDLGAKASEVLVLENGEPVFARTLSTGTEGLPGYGRAPRARHPRQLRRAPRAGRRRRPRACSSAAAAPSSPAPRASSPASLGDPGAGPARARARRDALGAEAMRELPRYAKALALALSLGGPRRRDEPASRPARRSSAASRGCASGSRVLAGLAAVILVSFVFSAWARLHAVHKERDALQGALGAVTKEVLGTEATTRAGRAGPARQGGRADATRTPCLTPTRSTSWCASRRPSPSSMTHDVEELDVQSGARHDARHRRVDPRRAVHRRRPSPRTSV